MFHLPSSLFTPSRLTSLFEARRAPSLPLPLPPASFLRITSAAPLSFHRWRSTSAALVEQRRAPRKVRAGLVVGRRLLLFHVWREEPHCRLCDTISPLCVVNRHFPASPLEHRKAGLRVALHCLDGRHVRLGEDPRSKPAAVGRARRAIGRHGLAVLTTADRPGERI